MSQGKRRGEHGDEGLRPSRLQLHQEGLLQGEEAALRRAVSFLTLPVLLQPPEEMLISGKYKTGEQILRLTNERFAVPEMLFHPSDIGIQEMGIPEAIVDSIQSLPEGQTPVDRVVWVHLLDPVLSSDLLLEPG